VEEQLFLVAFIRDITDRHQAERALRASEERFRRLVETANVVPWEADSRTNRLTYVGPQAEALLGYPLSDWYAEGFWINRVHVDDREYARTQLAAAGGGEVAGEFEYRMVHKDGHPVWVRDIVAADVTEQGPVLRGFRFDITERRRLEDELLQSQKMEAVGRLAGGIAHDFNNILTAILGYTAMVEQGLADRPELRADVIEIRRAAAHAADLTQQLLAFARKQVIRPRVLSIDELVGRVEKMVARLIGEDVQVAVVARTEGATARVDPIRLEQALLNLAINARDAMPRGGTLTLGTAVHEVDAGRAASEGVRAGSYVVITVTDTGVGMDPQTLARAFEPFFTTKRDGTGSGLGLSTAHGVIAQAGGFIQVESAPDRGSTFRVFLPLAREEAVAPEAPAPQPRVVTGPGTILLAEDEPQVRRLAERALLRGGYQVLVAQNGQEAVEQSRLFEGTIHLLLTDVLMPVMGGVQAADIIRSERPETRVLFVSGYSEDALFREGTESTVNFLNKPFTPADLDKKVREVLQT
jgi:PAS domain S-box-containing protein